MPTASRGLTTVLLLALVASAAEGCGGDRGAGGVASGTVTMHEYRFEPSNVVVARGETIAVVNKGKIAHNLTIERGPNPRTETKELAGTSTFLPGGTEELGIDLPPGRYAMVCTIPQHRELGMRGTLTVR
jgi:plastocyanin